jgi:hypothetical protein
MFHKGPVVANGACQKWHILFLDIFQRIGYFSTKLGASDLLNDYRVI